jgi:hypothetical protein
MTSAQIFILQCAVSLVVFSLIAIWYVAPYALRAPLRTSLPPLLLLNMRVLGLVFLVPQVVDPHLPHSFAVPAAYGDLTAAGLALISAVLLRANAPRALSLILVWLFNIEGTVDLLNAIYQGLATGIASYHLGAAWFIPTVYVPALLVTHALIFVLLLSGGRARRSTQAIGEAREELVVSGR